MLLAIVFIEQPASHFNHGLTAARFLTFYFLNYYESLIVFQMLLIRDGNNFNRERKEIAN